MTTMDKINKLLIKHNMRGYQLTDAIGLSRGMYSLWNTGKCGISYWNLHKIAQYFNVTYESLLPDPSDDEMDEMLEEMEKEKTPAQSNEGLSGLDQELIKTILSLSEAEKASLYAFLSTHKREE